MGNVMNGARERILSMLGLKRRRVERRESVEVHHVRYVKQDWRSIRDAKTAQLKRELGRGQ